jgi:hypothetical protein
MKTIKTINNHQCQCHRCDHAATCTGPESNDRVRLVINAVCAARAGSGRMTLNDWREAEQEVKRRLNYEYPTIQR